MIQLLSGNNSYLLDQAWQSKRAEYQKDYGQESVLVIDCDESEWSDLHQAIDGMSLFGSEEKLVIVRNISSNKDIINRLNDYIEQISSSTHVLIVEPKMDKRSVLYKSIKREGLVTEFSEPKEYELASWVAREVDARGGKISKSDAQFLVDRGGAQQMLLASEMDKLVSYNETVDRDMITLLVEQSINDTIFELLDAVSAGNNKRVMQLYDNLRSNKEQPIYILTMISWQMHILIATHLSGSAPDSVAAKLAGSSPYVIGKARRVVRGLSKQQLATMAKLIADADTALKTQSIDQDQAVKTLILRLIDEAKAR